MVSQTVFSLPDEVIAELSKRTHDQKDRSSLVAEALRYFFATHQSNCDDLERINAFADELNQEAEDVLDFQVIH